jgi:hypothetical protein
MIESINDHSDKQNFAIDTHREGTVAAKKKHGDFFSTLLP